MPQEGKKGRLATQVMVIKMKKICVLGWVILFIFSTMGVGITVVSASDTENVSEWARKEIEESIDAGFVLAELQSDYQSSITREEFAATAVMYLAYMYNMQVEDMIQMWCVKYTGEDVTPKELKSSFTDIEDSELADYIKYAEVMGIVKGRGNGMFDPFSYITREEAAVMLNNVFVAYSSGYKLGYYDLSKLTDIGKISEWAIASVKNMYAMNVMKGVSETEFSPQGSYTREQCFATFLRLSKNGNMVRTKNDALEFMSHKEMIEEIKSRSRYENLYEVDNENYVIMYGREKDNSNTYIHSFYIIYKNGGRKDIIDGFGFTGITLTNFELDKSGHYLYCNGYKSHSEYKYEINLKNALVKIIE